MRLTRAAGDLLVQASIDSRSSCQYRYRFRIQAKPIQSCALDSGIGKTSMVESSGSHC